MTSANYQQEGQKIPRASTPRKTAALFNSYFASVFSDTSRIPPLSTNPPSQGPSLNDLQIPVKMVLTYLKELDVNKASGSDGIPARLLKEAAEQITPSIVLLLNKSLLQGEVPDDWKLANIVPVFKKGKREHVENYRPISLLPTISKVLERCVLSGLRDNLYHRIYPVQHGFLPGRSCVT